MQFRHVVGEDITGYRVNDRAALGDGYVLTGDYPPCDTRHVVEPVEFHLADFADHLFGLVADRAGDRVVRR